MSIITERSGQLFVPGCDSVFTLLGPLGTVGRPSHCHFPGTRQNP